MSAIRVAGPESRVPSPDPRTRRRTLVAALSCCAVAIATMAAQGPPARIISLIPAVSEMLFAMGAGPQVVAVSSFDEYPTEVRNLPRVGALLDPDLERMLALKPDLVAIYATQTDLRVQLERAAIPVFIYEHAGLADVTTTIRALGERVGRAQEAARISAKILAHMAEIRRRTAGRPKPRTMLVISREALAIRAVYASGGVGFLHDMLEAAGGEDVFADVKRQSVQASTELILARRPEVIVELRGGEMPPDQHEKEVNAWRRLASLPAVQSGRVFLIADARTVVPGPRVAEGAELIARALHPDAFR